MDHSAVFTHRALARQLKRHLGLQDEAALESLLGSLREAAAGQPALGALAEQLPRFLQAVRNSYDDADRDLVLRTRSLSISSDELGVVNERLRRETQRQQEVLNTLRATTRELAGAGASTDVHNDAEGPDTAPGDEDLLGLAQWIRELLAQRARAQSEVMSTRSQLVSAIEALDVGFAMYDPDNRLVICNSTFRRFYPAVAPMLVAGAHMDDLLRAYHAAVIAPRPGAPDAATWVAEQHAARLSGQSRELRVGERWLREDNATTPDGLLVLLRTDITAMKELTLRMAQARDAAEAANQAKSEFLANMSHEIRTPMNGVLGMTALALDTQLDDEQREYLGMVKSSADALLTIIDDILDFSKMEAGMMTVESVPLDPASLLGDCLKPLGVRAFGQGLELVGRIAPEVPTQLLGDPGRLRQVLNNLVGNAIKFTESGQVSVEVTVAGWPAEDELELEFSVRDTGIGIPPEQQEEIFRPFSQADASITRRYGGTGLGLAIVRRLVGLMGGRLWLHSAPGEGSDFHFTVRVGTATSTDAPARALPAQAPLQGLSVLVVDDNATNGEWLAEAFRQWGMRPTVARSGEEALALLGDRARRFGVCLIDGDMPGMSGFDLATRLAEVPAALRHTWLMVTSTRLSEDAARAKALGVAGYLTKPVLPSELLDALLQKLGTSVHEIGPPLAPPSPAARAAQGGLHVLLVEDMPVNLTLATRLLERMGHRVSTAAHGALALELTATTAYDLVLMDMQMPVMDGLAATHAIRAREAAQGGGRHQPIVAMTANAMAGDRERCLAAGMDGYVSKPIDSTRLEAEMDRVLGRRANAGGRPAGAAPSPEPPDIDLADALQRLGDDHDLLLELAQLFLDDGPNRLAAIESAVLARDVHACKGACHDLSGTASNLSALALAALVGQISAQAQAGDWGRADELLMLLPVRLQSLENALEHWARTARPSP